MAHSKATSNVLPIQLERGHIPDTVVIHWNNGVKQVRFHKDLLKQLHRDTLTGNALWLRRQPQYVLRSVKVSREEMEKRYK